MKIAISGKGGVGKSTLAGVLSLLMAKDGKTVIALDADPDANLASALGLSLEEQKKIVPISRQVALIEERTGAKIKQYGQLFKLNPEVSDIVDKYAVIYKGVALIVLGAVEKGGSGCACPESVLIRSLVNDLVLYKNETLVMDMEAGIEHLGRSTAKGVDLMVVVIEPGQRSLDTAYRIKSMAEDIGLKNIKFVANKVIGTDDEKFIKQNFPDYDLLGVIPYSEDIRTTDRNGISVLDNLSPETYGCFRDILSRIEENI